MASKLCDLKQRAPGIALAAQPVTSVVLALLQALTDDEIDRIECGQLPDERLIRDLASRISQTELVVGDVLDRNIRQELIDFGPSYRAAEQVYRESGADDGQIERSLIAFTAPGTLTYLIWDEIHNWDSNHKLASMLNIEDEQYSIMCKGYLFSKGRWFDSCVSLLEKSMCDRWLHWESLWRYY